MLLLAHYARSAAMKIVCGNTCVAKDHECCVVVLKKRCVRPSRKKKDVSFLLSIIGLKFIATPSFADLN